jgi:signal transduction histidine kinase
MKFIQNNRTYIKNLSLGSKLIIAFSFLLTAICLFIYIYFPAKFEKQAMMHISQMAESISNISAYSIAPGLYFKDYQEINLLLRDIKKNKNFEYLVIHDTSNIPVVYENLNKAKNVNYTVLEDKDFLSGEGLIYKSSTVVRHNDAIIGTLYLGISTVDVRKSIYESRRSIAIYSIILFILGIGFVIGISTILTKPIKNLTKTFEIISEGDLSHRAIVNSKDEIGDLSNSFNLMVEKLEKAHYSLTYEIQVRKETEEELINAKEELSKSLEIEKNLNDLKSRFVSMVSHEYRTPLTVILTSTYLMEKFFQLQLKPEFSRQLVIVQNSVKNMVQLLDDILFLGKSDAGKLKVSLKSLDIIETIEDLVRQSEVLDKNNHEIIFQKTNESCFINSDENLLRQIFTNLISNAIKYSPKGSSVKINLEMQPEKVLFTIIDNGIGIPEDEKEFLFDSFFRARNVHEISGTGLGLSIVYRCVNALSGEITADSKENVGTIFVVEIPMNINQDNQ